MFQCVSKIFFTNNDESESLGLKVNICCGAELGHVKSILAVLKKRVPDWVMTAYRKMCSSKS